MALERSHIPAHLAPDLLDMSLVERSLYDLLAAHYGLVLDRGEQVIEAGIADSGDAGLLGLAPGSAVLLLQRHTWAGAVVGGVRRVDLPGRPVPVARLARTRRPGPTGRRSRGDRSAARLVSASPPARCSSGSTGPTRPRGCAAAAPDLGGVVLFGDNLRADGDAARIAKILRADADVLLAADEEGGDVTRLHYTTRQPDSGQLRARRRRRRRRHPGGRRVDRRPSCARPACC